MATLKELQAKQAELAQSGQKVSLLDAKKALTAVTPTAPTPVTPTPAPTGGLTTQEALKATKGMTFDERQAAMGAIKTEPVKDLTPPTQAPTPVETPKAPEPVKTPTPAPTPTPVKTEARTQPTVDFNSSVGREGEINTNLANITAQNQGLLLDRNAYNNAFGYSTADDGKKAIMDNFFTNKQKELTNPENIFNSLMNGVDNYPSQIKETLNYKNAKERFTNFQKFSSFTPSQFQTALKTGDIIQGTTTYNDLLKDPVAKLNIEKAKTLNNISGEKIDNDAIEQNEMNKLANSPIGKALADNFISQEEVDTLINTDELKGKIEALNEEKLKLNEIQARYDNIENSIRAELKGTGATEDYISQRVANARKLILPELNLAQNNYNTNYGFYTEQRKNAMELLYSNIDAYREQKRTEQAMQQQKDLALFNQKLGLETEQAKFDQQIANQAKLLNDPQTAISSVMQEYKALGVPFMESLQTKVQKANEYIKNGGTLSGYIDQMIKDAQAKPEYKAYTEKQTATGNQTDYKVIGKDANGNDVYGFVNTQTQTVTPVSGFTGVGAGADFRSFANKYPNEASLKNNNPAGITWNANFDKGTGFAAILRENGVNFEKGTARPLNEGGNYVTFPTVEDGMKAYDLLWNTDRYQNMTVQKALDTWGTGSLNLGPINPSSKISQLSQDQLQQIKNAQLKKESPGFYKELTNLKTQTAPKELTPARIENYNSLTATDKNKKQNDPTYVDFLNKKQQVMSDENASIYDVMKYSQGGKDMGEERLKSLGKFSQGLSQIEDLTKSINENTTGPIIGRLRSYNPYDPNAQALIAQINSVVPNIARGVYGEVGVLTDADIQNYTKTLPNIKSTEDTNKLVLAMTLQTMVNGFKGQLQIDGSAGRDVSGFGGTVKQYETRINNLLSQIGGGATQTNTGAGNTTVNPKYYNIATSTR